MGADTGLSAGEQFDKTVADDVYLSLTSKVIATAQPRPTILLFATLKSR
jgi:hypothetical protein